MVRALENHKDYEEHHQEHYNDHDHHHGLKKIESFKKKDNNCKREEKDQDQFMEFSESTPDKDQGKNEILKDFVELAKLNVEE